jgi:hypothetical protein
MPRPTGAPRLVVGLGATTAVASAFGASSAARVGLRPSGRQGLALSLDLARVAQPGIAEGRGVASAGWLWTARLGPARGWAGAVAGGGAIEQTASGRSRRWSGALVAGPAVGAAVDLTGRFGFWGEAQLSGVAYRLDGQTAFALSPSLFVGMFVEL